MRQHTAVQTCAGDEHSLLLTETGHVYAFGRSDLGQLGMAVATAHHRTQSPGPHGGDAAAAGIVAASLARHDARRPVAVATLQDVNVVSVAAGAEHSVVLTNDGSALAFGAGDGGQLGRHAAEYQCEADAFRPVRVVIPERLRVVQVRAARCVAGRGRRACLLSVWGRANRGCRLY